MKNLNELKLSSLSKKELSKKELDRLQGGNYCAYSWANNYANTGSGLCSGGSYMKATTGWGQYC